MLKLILGYLGDYLWNSGVIKTTTASAVGSAAVVVGLGQYQVEAIELKFKTERADVEQYVDTRHVEAMTSIVSINKRQDEIFIVLNRIDDKLWQLKNKEK